MAKVKDKLVVKSPSKWCGRAKKWVFIFDFILLFVLSQIYPERETVFNILMVGVLIWQVVCFFRNWVSNSRLLITVTNYRVIGIRGAQGAGKSSMACKLLTLFRKKKKCTIVTNVPVRLYGEYTNVLTKDALSMRTRLPDPSALFMDEMSLYFNNMEDVRKNKITKAEIRGTEANLQLIRHNFNGHFLGTSVKMGRILAVLEEKFGMEYNMLEQRSIPNALIFPFVYNLIRKFLGKPYEYFGLRRWKVQTFLAIQDGSNSQGYTYDLSTDNANTKTKKYAPLLYVYSWNDNSFEYDDRFAKELYKSLPEEKLKKFTSLQFTPTDLDKSGFDSLKTIYGKMFEQALETVDDP